MRDVRTLHRLLMFAGSAFILAAAAFLALWLIDFSGGDDGSPGASDAGTVTGFDLRLERSRAAATATATAEAAPDAETTPVAGETPTVEETPVPEGKVPGWLVIPSIDVEAPVVTLGVDSAGVMESPSTPTDVGWYDFTARPGALSNAVFSGHVDFYNYGEAVFWDLRKLEGGDIVEVHGEDHTVYRYEVVSSLTYPADEAPVGEIIGDTDKETVTLLTCAGTFDSGVRQYSHRLVVQAERIEDGEPAVSQ